MYGKCVGWIDIKEANIGADFSTDLRVVNNP